MFDIVTISLSTAAGFIFFYVLSSYELRSRLKNSILIIIATILDTYPVFFGGMTESVTLLGAIHGLITMAAYYLLFCWGITYNKTLYKIFCYIWIIAYLSGYLAAVKV